MTCPWCGSEKTFCRNTKQKRGERWRRYHYPACGGRFSTTERPILLREEEQRRQANRQPAQP